MGEKRKRIEMKIALLFLATLFDCEGNRVPPQEMGRTGQRRANTILPNSNEETFAYEHATVADILVNAEEREKELIEDGSSTGNILDHLRKKGRVENNRAQTTLETAVKKARKKK